MHRHRGLEHLLEMPGDRFPLPVFVGRQIEHARLGEKLLQLLHLQLLAGRNDIERLKTPIDVDPRHRSKACFQTLGIRRNLLVAGGQITDMTDARLDLIVAAQKAPDRLGLRRRLHDHQRPPSRR